MEEEQGFGDFHLQPLKYHRDLVAYLKEAEPHVWEWAQSADVRKQQADEVREAMLRQTYRLEPQAHPAGFKACHAAMDKLSILAPVTLYQAADGTMNASLCFIPGEIHLVFYGPILERLDDGELLALMGHELAHYCLWSAEDGTFFNASRILDHALSHPDATPSHRETARLLSLHTELYADRGSAIAVGEIAPAISLLVKTMTGLSAVDPAAYLRQAEELEASNAKSIGNSHPEAFLRARALDLWWRKEPDLEVWLEKRLLGPLSIEALDLLRQQELTRLTKRFFARFLGQVEVPREEILTQVRRFFPGFRSGEEPLDYQEIGAPRIDDPTRNYFIALMFDCAMADPEACDHVMLAAAKTAEVIGATDLFKAALKRDLSWTKQMTDRLIAQAAKTA
jgi:hypothetical protein